MSEKCFRFLREWDDCFVYELGHAIIGAMVKQEFDRVEHPMFFPVRRWWKRNTGYNVKPNFWYDFEVYYNDELIAKTISRGQDFKYGEVVYLPQIMEVYLSSFQEAESFMNDEINTRVVSYQKAQRDYLDGIATELENRRAKYSGES